MPLINIVIALIVVGVALWLINNVHPHGLQHQDDSECSGCRCGRSLGLAGGRNVGAGNQLQVYELSRCDLTWHSQ